MQYFDHSTTAASDDKIIALRMFFGHGAVDACWAIVERVHRDEKPLGDNKFAIGALAQTICETADVVSEWITGMVEIGLLEKTEDGYTSERITENINKYHSKVEQAVARGKASAKARENKAKSASKDSETTLKKVSTNKTKQNEEGAEPREAQLLRPNFGSGEMADAAAETGDDFDWDAVINELRRARFEA